MHFKVSPSVYDNVGTVVASLGKVMEFRSNNVTVDDIIERF